MYETEKEMMKTKKISRDSRRFSSKEKHSILILRGAWAREVSDFIEFSILVSFCFYRFSFSC